MRYGVLIAATVSAAAAIGRIIDAGELPTTPDGAVVWLAFWAMVVAAIRMLRNVHRWRRTLVTAASSGRLLQGGSTVARRLAQWTLGATLLLGACATPEEAPGIEYLGPIESSTALEATASSATPPSEPTTTTMATTSSTSTPPTSASTTTALQATAPSIDDETTTGESDLDTDVASTVGTDAPTNDERVPVAHIVEPGDHLWGIAEATVRARVAADQVTQELIATYWVEVMAMNRGQLMTSDPNTIHPGEIVMLPPVADLMSD